jgi:tetratricopeptide (TPR) repeat protein
VNVSAVRPLVSLSASLLCATVLIVKQPASVADAPSAPKVAAPKPEIAEAVRRLGSGKFADREKAQQTLWLAGADAEPALRAALQDADPEVVRRARTVLDKFDWGIYPNTPPAMLALIERIRDGDDDAKRQAIGELIRLQGPGYVVLAKLVARTDLLDYLASGGEDVFATYVALTLVSGTLPEVIARWEAVKSDRSAEALAALYRAKGDFATARKHAAENSELLHDLIWEQGDWKALAELPPQVPNQRAPITLATRAACLRLAGDTKGASEALDGLRKIEKADDAWPVARGLLLNGHSTEAVDRLRKADGQQAVLFDVLVAQLQYKAALAVADDSEQGGELAFRKARALYLLGDKDRAGQLFTQVASKLTAPADADELAKLVRTENGFGLKTAAREHAVGYLANLARLAVNPQMNPAGTVLDAVFPKRGVEARVWWLFLQQKYPKDDATGTMKRVADLLDAPAGAAGPAEFTEALLAAQEDAAQTIAARHALAAAHEAVGQIDAARKHLAAAAEADMTGAAAIKLGDFHLNRRQFTEAAAAYADAWKYDKSQPLPLALQGWALTKAGRTDEGKAVLDQAHVLPLGSVLVRASLAEELTKRDAIEPARRERELILKLGWARSWSSSNFLSYYGRDAAVRKDYARAADAYERVVLGVVASDIDFIEKSAYLSVPALARAHRARAALAAGRVEDALAHARACLESTPGNMDVALLLVPELEKRGRKADADALYDRSAGAYAALTKDFPKSGFAHNAAAWLAACCHRDLDAALDHARKATELEPKQAGYKDTLAEVHFQRGETATAITLMRECIKLDPRKAYFGKQLKRFEAGDRTTSPPDEDDDE